MARGEKHGSGAGGRRKTGGIARLAIAAAGLALIGAAMAGIWGCNRTNAGAAQSAARQAAVPVSVGTAVRKDVRVELRNFGAVEAYQTISVRSQVGGVIMEVHFAEGQVVKAGDLLFSIDPRPFEAAVNQLQANLAKDKAQAGLAEVEARRNEELYNKGIVSADDRDTTRAAADAAQAAVRADQAALDNAKLQLAYCHITSPVTGVAGRWLINQGNVVQANTDVLVVINQVQPVNVTFTVPEKYLPEIRRYQAIKPLEVRATIPNHPDVEKGELAFINNTVDTTTGTITLKGRFANENEHLWPGQYVNVVLVLRSEPGAIVISSAAIQTSQQGPFVYVVEPDRTAEVRPVTIGLALNGETSISEGLNVGETVVTDGQLRLTPGMPVEVMAAVTGATPSAPGPPTSTPAPVSKPAAESKPSTISHAAGASLQRDVGSGMGVPPMRPRGVPPLVVTAIGEGKMPSRLMGGTPMPLMGETPMPLMGETPVLLLQAGSGK